jgi:septal ring factor EnvC (AmiA/AmiB activator)
MSGERSFGFVRDLLECQVDQIEKIGGPERAEIYRGRVEQLGQYSEILHSHLHADVIGLSQQVFAKMQADQAARQAEVQRLVEERAKRIAEMKSSDEAYQRDREMAARRAQAAEFGIAGAKESLAKIQALLQASEEALAKEKRAIAYLDARREHLQQELGTQSSELERMELQFAIEMSFSEEAMRVKALADVERIREEEIERTKGFIRELARLG